MKSLLKTISNCGPKRSLLPNKTPAYPVSQVRDLSEEANKNQQKSEKHQEYIEQKFAKKAATWPQEWRTNVEQYQQSVVKANPILSNEQEKYSRFETEEEEDIREPSGLNDWKTPETWRDDKKTYTESLAQQDPAIANKDLHATYSRAVASEIEEELKEEHDPVEQLSSPQTWKKDLKVEKKLAKQQHKKEAVYRPE